MEGRVGQSISFFFSTPQVCLNNYLKTKKLTSPKRFYSAGRKHEINQRQLNRGNFKRQQYIYKLGR